MKARIFPTESRDITLRPSPPGEAQMLCWLASGEHEALIIDMKRADILIPAKGIPTSTARVYPTERRDTTFRAPSWGDPKMLCWLAFGNHEALTSDLSTSPKMVLLQGKPTTVLRIFPTGSRATTLRGPPLGGPNALLASIWRS